MACGFVAFWSWVGLQNVLLAGCYLLVDLVVASLFVGDFIACLLLVTCRSPACYLLVYGLLPACRLP